MFAIEVRGIIFIKSTPYCFIESSSPALRRTASVNSDSFIDKIVTYINEA